MLVVSTATTVEQLAEVSGTREGFIILELVFVCEVMGRTVQSKKRSVSADMRRR